MTRRARQSGFTLLELVLVLVITAVALAIAAPSLRGWSRGADLHNSSDQFLTLTRLGRTQAITTGTIYQLKIDANNGKYQLNRQQGTEFVEVAGSNGQVFSVPAGGQMQLDLVGELTEADVQAIYFYPNGRTQAATVTISDGKGFAVKIQCNSPAEDFYLAEEGKL